MDFAESTSRDWPEDSLDRRLDIRLQMLARASGLKRHHRARREEGSPLRPELCLPARLQRCQKRTVRMFRPGGARVARRCAPRTLKCPRPIAPVAYQRAYRYWGVCRSDSARIPEAQGSV